MVYICTKFHENILNGNRVMEQTRKVIRWKDGGHNIIQPVSDGRIKRKSPKRMDRWMSGQTDRGHNIIRPIFDRRIKRKSPKIIQNTIMSAAMGFSFLGTQEQVRNSRGIQAIIV